MNDLRWWLESFTVHDGSVPVVGVVEESLAWDERDQHAYRQPYAGPHPFTSSAVGVHRTADWITGWEEPERDQRSQARRSRSRRRPGGTVTPRGNPTRPTRSDAD